MYYQFISINQKHLLQVLTHAKLVQQLKTSLSNKLIKPRFSFIDWSITMFIAPPDGISPPKRPSIQLQKIQLKAQILFCMPQ